MDEAINKEPPSEFRDGVTEINNYVYLNFNYCISQGSASKAIDKAYRMYGRAIKRYSRRLKKVDNKKNFF